MLSFSKFFWKDNILFCFYPRFFPLPAVHQSHRIDRPSAEYPDRKDSCPPKHHGQGWRAEAGNWDFLSLYRQDKLTIVIGILNNNTQMRISLNTKISAKLFLYYERINERTETVFKKRYRNIPFLPLLFFHLFLPLYSHIITMPLYCHETFQQVSVNNTSSFCICVIFPHLNSTFSQTNTSFS